MFVCKTIPYDVTWVLAIKMHKIIFKWEKPSREPVVYSKVLLCFKSFI